MSTLLLAMAVAMNPASFHHVTFDALPPSVYGRDDDTIRIDVDKSSSFLLQAFERPLLVKDLSFEWKSIGDLHVNDAAMQKRKDGDDARLRIGLIVAGDAPMVPFFAPSWVKMVRDHLKHPAGEIMFVLAGTPVARGSSWPSPYNDDMQLIAANQKDLADGWHEGRWHLDKPRQVVGLWIMADGDNTKSKFTTWLRKLTLD